MTVVERVAKDLGLKKVTAALHIGEIEGYHSILSFNQSTNRTVLQIGFSSDVELDSKNLIADLLLVKHVVSAAQRNHMIEIAFKTVVNYNKMKETIDEVLQKTLSFLRSAGVSTGCMNCGSKEDLATYHIDSKLMHLCSNCYVEINHAFEKEFEQRVSKPVRHLPGIVGAILGTLIGAGIWAIIYRMGFVAWFVGFAIVFLTLKGYEIFGGRIGKVGMIAGVLLAFAGVLFGNYLGWCWDIFDEIKHIYEVSYFDVFGHAYTWLFDPSDKEALMAFIKNTGLGLLAVLIGGIPLSIASMNESSGRKEIKRLN